ncbi:MAG: ribbon-helix-helix protein, CopG family [Campylobacterales bacterium]
MHTISLKTDDGFFELLEDMVKKLGTTKSDLIRRAVLSYKESLEREILKEQIKKASMLTRSESIKISEEFDEVNGDGLKSV